MSRRLDVLAATKALVALALPTAEVLGLDGEEAPATRIRPGGRVIVRSGDPGEPEMDLSPLTYNWSHRIPVELGFIANGPLTAEQQLDAALVAIGAAIVLNRQLGGLCTWLDALAPETENAFVEGAKPPRTTELIILATYATTSPTG